MRTTPFVTWLMLATIAIPQAALPTLVPTDAAHREALSAVDLAAARGGSVPTTKIGAKNQYGSLSVYRNLGGTRFCGTPSPDSARIVPATVGHPECNNSIPVHSFVDDSVDVLIGGMSAVVKGSAPPSFVVYVNGVEVPTAQLGNEFQQTCPKEGEATADGATLERYNCDVGLDHNWAKIPVGYFHGGFNTLTVYHRMAEAAFKNWGDDMDTRIIVMQ